MAGVESKIVGELNAEDLRSIGLPVDQFSQEAESLGLQILEGYVRTNRLEELVFPNVPAYKRWRILNHRYDRQIEIFGQYGNEDSIIGNVDNLIVPMSGAIFHGHEGDEEDGDHFLIEAEEASILDGSEHNQQDDEATFSSFTPDINTALKAGMMFIMNDTVDELVDLTQAAGAPEYYGFYQARVLYFRVGEILVRANGVCLADLSNGKRREKLSLTDQYRFLTTLMTLGQMDPEQSELADAHPVITTAQFHSAANIARVMLNPPIKEIRDALKRSRIGREEAGSLAAERFISIAEHVSRVRDLMVKKLTSPADAESDQIRTLVEQDLSSTNAQTRAAVIEFLRLDQPANIWSLYRQAVKTGNTRIAQAAEVLASNLEQTPFLVAEDLAEIYDPELGSAVGEVTNDQLQQIVKSTRLYSLRDFSFEGDELLFSGLEYGGIRLPTRIKVEFDRQQSQRKFKLKLEYEDSEWGVLTHGMDFDLQKGGVVDWQLLDETSDPRMAGLLRSSLLLTHSVLELIRQQCDVRVQQREALRNTATIAQPAAPVRKGPHVPAPKFPHEKVKQAISPLSEPIEHNGNGKKVIREVIVMPEGDDLDELLEELRIHPRSVEETFLAGIRTFNEADTQVGIEALKNAKGHETVYKWGCRTEVGYVRALLVPAGSEESGNCRTRFWKAEVVGRRAGFYRRWSRKYGFDSKDV